MYDEEYARFVQEFGDADLAAWHAEQDHKHRLDSYPEMPFWKISLVISPLVYGAFFINGRLFHEFLLHAIANVAVLWVIYAVAYYGKRHYWIPRYREAVRLLEAEEGDDDE